MTGRLHAHPPTATGLPAHIPGLNHGGNGPDPRLGSHCPVWHTFHPRCHSIAPFIQEHDVVLLENHGALSVGADLITAYYRMETLELQAKISLTARLLGGEREISGENIDRLIRMREGFKLTGRHPGYKKYSG